MVRLWFGCWVLLLGCPSATAQWLETGSARLAGLGATGAALGKCLWQAQGNPAGIAGTEGPVAGFSLASHYLVPELSPAYAAAVVPLAGRHAVGLGLRSVGFGGYRESLAGLSYAVRAGWAYTGVRISAQWADFTDDGPQTTWLLDAGALLVPLPKLALGLWVSNGLRARYPGSQAASLPRQVFLGLQYRPSPRVHLLLDAVWPQSAPTDYRLGAELRAHDYLHLQAGVRTRPAAASAGVAFRWSRLWVQVATAYHTQLGTTPTLGLEQDLGRNVSP